MHQQSGLPPRPTSLTPFVSNYSSTNLIDRSIFLSCLQIQSSLNKHLYLSHSYGLLRLTHKTRSLTLQFVKTITSNTTKFLNFVEKLRSHLSTRKNLTWDKNLYVRQVILSNEDVVKSSPLGGMEITTSSIQAGCQLSTRVRV